MYNVYLCAHSRAKCENMRLSYAEVDANGLVLALDLVGEVVQEAYNGGLLQGHGLAEAGAHHSGPVHSHTVPVMQVGQAHAAVVAKQAVQCPLHTHTHAHTHITANYY